MENVSAPKALNMTCFDLMLTYAINFANHKS